MLVEDFDKLHNFKSNEKVLSGEKLSVSENISKVKDIVMILVDDWVSFVKKYYRNRISTCTIHCITSGKHESGSAHYSGMAVDCHITGLSLFEMVVTATMFPFKGIGFYPFQNTPFVHVDLKDRGNGRKTLWYRNKEGLYIDTECISDVIKTLKEI
jgi:hypothetical protein